jgi:hypothetical protein
MGDYQIIIEVGCCVYLILVITFLVVVSLLYHHIISFQPWVVKLLRYLYQFTFTVLYIPLITIAISSFDCRMNEKGSFVLCGSNIVCGKALQVSTMILCIVHLILLLCFSSIINILIFPNNPKLGGMFTSSSGFSRAVHSVLTFGLVFAMRLLWDWSFWRGVVTVGTSLLLVVYYVYFQPYYCLRYNLK